MTLFSKEHYDLVQQFDRDFKQNRLDKEAKEFWPKGYVYQDGAVNELFLAYRKGYSLAKAQLGQ